MPIEGILFFVIAIVGGGLQLYFTWGWNQWPARWVPLTPWLLVLVLMLLGGCATREAPPPEPPPLPAPIVCAAPGGMTAAEPEPERPRGDYTQRQVAGYLIDLHRWGWRGWRRLEAVDDYTERCRDGAELTDAED